MTVPTGELPDGSRLAAAKGARVSLLLLLGINMFNYMDRYILAAALPRIEVDPAIAPVSKGQLGLLTTAFVASYLVLSPVFGWLGDRMSRWLLVGVGVILWSLASGGSGLATAYTVLLLTRAFVGVGEAAYGPVAPSLLSDLYPVRMRGWVMAWFYAAIPVGSALGYVLGGVVADSALGWRWAFYMVVFPGIILGLLSLLMKEPARGLSDAAVGHGVAGLRDCICLARIPSYVYNTVAATAMCFAIGGVAIWMPTYIYEREGHYVWTPEVKQKLRAEKDDPLPPDLVERLDRVPDRPAEQFLTLTDFEKELAAAGSGWKVHRATILKVSRTADSQSLSSINTIFGGILAVGGLVATIVGGLVGDWLRPRFPGSYFQVSGWAAVFGVPTFLLVLITPFPYAWGLLFLSILGLFFNTGPSNTILANVSPPGIRSSAFAINILAIHILGDAISPTLIGFIADYSSLQFAFFLLSAVILLAAGSWLFGSKHLAPDTERAPTLLAKC
ncbi:MAG: spinster family MFS transporter [Gemmataceae bacterium]